VSNLPDLPASNDEYWEGAEKMSFRSTNVPICKTHTAENWQAHKNYVMGGDGQVHCMFCSWGGLLPGYMRVQDGQIVDLRNL